MQQQLSFSQILGPYQQMIEQTLREEVVHLGSKNPLRDACEYALLNGGKRFRPALVLMIAKALGYACDVRQAALGIEYFHTASLIADDLPCMDNDDERRNKPTVHRLFGESIALLATYALIAAGYACIAKNGDAIQANAHPFAHLGDRICMLALENASFNTGFSGATGGQFLDLAQNTLSVELLREVIHKKTVTLFEISFVWGWLFGGGDEKSLDLVKKCAGHFGMAFQIADDIDDMVQDKAHDHPLNMANFIGKEKAKEMFHEEIAQFHVSLAQLGLESSELTDLAHLLKSSVG